MFKGTYHGRNVHANDLVHVLRRAKNYGVERIMITAGCLSEVQEAVALIKGLEGEFPGMLATTVGVHPTRANEFEAHDEGPEAYLGELRRMGWRHKELSIAAVGEFGLDYDRVEYSSPEIQRRCFEAQFVLAEDTQLPLFLHMRNAADDFLTIVRENRHRFSTGVVHSFTGTAEEARRILDLDLFIGINGCSLKTEENLEVVKSLPLDKIMVESDAPWCEIRPSSAASRFLRTKPRVLAKEKHDPQHAVKSRNEPYATLQVLEVLAGLHNVPIEDMSERIYRTTLSVFS